MLRAFLADAHGDSTGDINPLIPADYDIIWSGLWFIVILVE